MSSHYQLQRYTYLHTWTHGWALHTEESSTSIMAPTFTLKAAHSCDFCGQDNAWYRSIVALFAQSNAHASGALNREWRLWMVRLNGVLTLPVSCQHQSMRGHYLPSWCIKHTRLQCRRWTHSLRAGSPARIYGGQYTDCRLVFRIFCPVLFTNNGDLVQLSCYSQLEGAIRMKHLDIT